MNDPRLEAMGDTPGSDVCGCTRVMLAYPEGSGSLGPGRCSVCKTPWIWNVNRRIWVAKCDCHKGSA